MNESPRVRAYDSQSTAYHDAFQVFLACTDQKRNARRWLDALVEMLPGRGVFIDAGAGNGQVTAWYADKFERTIAIEPSPTLGADLRRNCPTAQVLPMTILDAQPGPEADLVLCSHVLYYLDRSEWLPTLERLASWLSRDGALVVALQNHETDCMKLVNAFHGRRFDLSALSREFAAKHSADFSADLQHVPSQVMPQDEAAAYTVAEFMLNLLPMRDPPARRALEEYLATHFKSPEGVFRFSCHQEFLLVRRKSRDIPPRRH